MTKQSGRKSKPQARKSKPRRANQGQADAAYPIRFPFQSSGFKWPDDRTSQSACLTSRYRVTLVPTHESGTSVTHAVGAIITPNPETGLFVVNMPGASTNLADTNAAGTAYCSQVPTPNLSTIKASPGLIRCTGIGARITYGGTELQQAGRFVAGLAKHVYTPGVRAGTGTRLSAMSSITSGRNTELGPADFFENLTNLSTARNGDGVFEAHWRPSKVPQYMAIDNATVVLTTAAGVSPADNTSTPLNQTLGLQGVEAGESSLVVLIDGDVTATASATGNPYFLEVIWHWEYIPMDPLKTIVNISYSPFIPNLLADIINSLELGSTAFNAQYTSDQSGEMPVEANYINPGRVYQALSGAARTTNQVFQMMQRTGMLPGNRRQARLAY